MFPSYMLCRKQNFVTLNVLTYMLLPTTHCIDTTVFFNQCPNARSLPKSRLRRVKFFTMTFGDLTLCDIALRSNVVFGHPTINRIGPPQGVNLSSFRLSSGSCAVTYHLVWPTKRTS
jgi:hypothetical protein